jgi:hypothetical protein
MATKKSSPLFQLGDRVKIRYSDWQGRIVEFRGPLGVGGMLIYRVRVPHKPKPIYIELPEDQLVAVPTPPKVKPSPFARQAPEASGHKGEEPTSPKVPPSRYARRRIRDAQEEG